MTSIPLGVVGLILGLVARNNPHDQGFCTAGIVLSLVGSLISMLYFIVVMVISFFRVV